MPPADPPEPTAPTNTTPIQTDSQRGVMTSAYVNSDDERKQDSPGLVQRPSKAPASGTRAVIYRRVSSPGRVETDFSIAAQREACLRTARELGFSLIDEYLDPDAWLRRRPKRQVFRRIFAWFRGH
jgi:hypothetical protein